MRFLRSIVGRANCGRFWAPARSISTVGSSIAATGNNLAAALKVNSPWLMIPPPSDSDCGGVAHQGIDVPVGCSGYNITREKFKYNHFYSLEAESVIMIEHEQNFSDEFDWHVLCFGSSNGWLAFLNRGDGSIFLSNPITGRRINLPSTCTLPCHPPPHPVYYNPIEAIVLSSPDPDAEDCRVMITYSSLGDGQKLAFCSSSSSVSRGHITSSWICLPSVHDEQNYLDVMYSSRHQLFFAMDDDSRIETWDLRDPFMPKRASRDKVMRIDVDHRSEPYGALATVETDLVPLPDDHNNFFIIRRFVADHVTPDGTFVNPYYHSNDETDAEYFHYNTWAFDVYKYDIKEKIVTYMEDSLEDRAIFVGLNQGFSLSTARFRGLRPNAIYFTDAACSTFGKTFGGHDIGIFYYKDKAFGPCYFPLAFESNNLKRIEPIPLWFTLLPGYFSPLHN